MRPKKWRNLDGAARDTFVTQIRQPNKHLLRRRAPEKPILRLLRPFRLSEGSVNFRRLLVTVYAVRLLLQGREGEAIVAELRDWNGPRRSTYRAAAAIVVLLAALSLSLWVTGGSDPTTSTELARLRITR